MWYKIEDIESKYNISKFSIYALITKDQNLRKCIKANDGSLQINKEGLEIITKNIKNKQVSLNSSEDILKTEINDENLEPKKFFNEKNDEKIEEEFFTKTSLDREEVFFADEIKKHDKTPIEEIVEEGVDEIEIVKKMSSMEDSNSIDMQSYIKALKEKMIIQNEQIRAINNLLEIFKKLLIQDEKIVSILEKNNK